MLNDANKYTLHFCGIKDLPPSVMVEGSFYIFYSPPEKYYNYHGLCILFHFQSISYSSQDNITLILSSVVQLVTNIVICAAKFCNLFEPLLQKSPLLKLVSGVNVTEFFAVILDAFTFRGPVICVIIVSAGDVGELLGARVVTPMFFSW